MQPEGNCLAEAYLPSYNPGGKSQPDRAYIMPCPSLLKEGLPHVPCHLKTKSTFEVLRIDTQNTNAYVHKDGCFSFCLVICKLKYFSRTEHIIGCKTSFCLTSVMASSRSEEMFI